MATNKETLFDKTLNGSFWNAGVTFERTNPIPLEKYSIFKSFDDAQDYARNNAVSYLGQILTVIGGEQVFSDWKFSDENEHTIEFKNGKWYIDDIVCTDAKLTDCSLSVTNGTTTATRTITTPYDVKNYKIVDTNGKLILIDAAILPGDLPIASATLLGAIKVGTGLDIAEDGTLSAQKLTVDLQVEGNEASTNPASTKAVYNWSLSTLDTASQDAQAKADAAQAAGELSAQSVRNDLTAYAKYTDVKTPVTDDNKIVTQDDIAALTGVMHFVGTTTDENLINGYTGAPTGINKYKDKAAGGEGKNPEQGDFVLRSDNSKEFVYVGTWNTGTWNEIGDESLYVTKSEYNTWQLSVNLSVDNLSTCISNLIISVDNKVKIGTGKWDSVGLSATYDIVNKTSLSVVKITDEDYYKLVAKEQIDPDIIYIVSSDYINGYNQRVINVGNAISATDAVNLSGMNAAIDAAKQEIVANSLSGVTLNGVEFTVANNVATLSIDIINCGGAN